MFGRTMGVGSAGGTRVGRLALAVVVVLSCTAVCVQPRLSPARSPPRRLAASTSEETALPIPDPADDRPVVRRPGRAKWPLAVYAPTVSAGGSRLAAHGFPVFDSTDPGSYDGPVPEESVGGRVRRDPGTGGVQGGRGWLVVIENFHGDLGDVTGEEVGSVAGRRPLCFTSTAGSWCSGASMASGTGFWAGFSRAVLVAAALGMEVVSGRSSREIAEYLLLTGPGEGLYYVLHDGTRTPRQNE